MLLNRLFVTVLITLVPLSSMSLIPAQAQPASRHLQCNIYADQAELRVAKIINRVGANVYFDWLECGDTLKVKCLQNYKFKFNQYILVGAVTGKMMCAAADNDHHGLIHSADAKLITRHDISISNWAGLWRRDGGGYDRIVIKPGSHGDLLVDATLYWDGRPRYALHYGGFKGSSKPVGNHLKIKSGVCHVHMTKLGKWLVVSDNHQCGALNVNSDGIYWRHGIPPKPPVVYCGMLCIH